MGSNAIYIPLNGLENGVGPRNGNPENPAIKPAFRREPLHVEMTDTGPTLHRHDRSETAAIGLKDEKAWHRMAAYMLLAGRTNSEIGAAAGVTPNHVSQLRAQRWFQELLATLANEAGNDLTGVIQSEAQASLQTMVDIRDDLTAPVRVRYAAAKDLVELAHGKAVQKTIVSRSSSGNRTPEEEYNEIQEQLKAMQTLRDNPSQSTQP